MSISVQTLVQAFARYKSIVDDWDAFVESLARPLPPVVWTNTLRVDGATLELWLREEGLEPTPLPWYPGAFRLAPNARPGRTWLYRVGLMHIQEEVSLLPVRLLNPRPGERVLDMAAAPGGKTAQTAVLMANRGTVVANDVTFVRMRALRHVLERLGLVNVSTIIHDGANLPRAIGGFDKVLVDAPCSCEGTVRKNPQVVHLCSLDFSLDHQGLQKALLRKAVLLCKPGGRIVYSTCTFAPEENEVVVDAVIRDFGAHRLRLVPARVPGFRVAPGLDRWGEQTFVAGMAHAARVWPHHNNTGGFFVAVLEKSPEGWGTRPPDSVPVADLWPDRVVPRPEELAFLEERFGFSPEVFEGYTWLRLGRKGVHIVNADHHPPSRPQPDAVGLLFVHTKARTPKITTAGALMFGRAATRNVVPLDERQRDAYLSRREVNVSSEQVADCTGPGFVIVTHRGVPLGTGLLRHRPPARYVLESLFPKGWMRG